MISRGVFDLTSDIDETGYISCFHLERDEDYLPKNKKSEKIKNVLQEIENNHNHSWYCEMRKRIQRVGEMDALFFRGNKITFKEMMERADALSVALYNAGVRKGNEIAVCMCNIPELVYVMLALNKIGAKMNSFSASYDLDYIHEIIKGCDTSVLIATDDVISTIREQINNSHFETVVVVSKSRSLPPYPQACDEYVKELDKYYQRFDFRVNLTDYKKTILTYDQFLEKNGAQVDVPDEGDLDTEFLVSYTSGSTKIGFPKAIIHTNRSLIVSGRFHDAEVSGNPDLKGLRALAIIHPDSNTCLITCISDILMQGWCVALEPEYNVENALDYLMLNKPNYANMTSAFWNEAARQYLIEKRYSGAKLGFLLAAFVVGESIGCGEEYFLNKFLKTVKAGNDVSLKGFRLPYVPISIGGGDCEHGGIYYTLWKTLYSKLYGLKLRGKAIGMLPEKYVVVTALRNNNGRWTECSRNEIGIIVANSATTMKGYKNNKEETFNKIIKDDRGRDWISCSVLGFIDEMGAVHVKGRLGEEYKVGNVNIYPFMVDDIIDNDKKNILSSTTVFRKDGSIVANIIKSPLAEKSEKDIVEQAMERCKKELPSDFTSRLVIKVFSRIIDFPLTASGKRNIRALEELV